MRKLITLLFILITCGVYGQTNSILYGRALNEFGSPIPNVKIEITYVPWNKTITTFTDKRSKFIVGNLKIGDKYNVKYVCENYLDVIKEGIYINIGTNDIILYMQRKNANKN